MTSAEGKVHVRQTDKGKDPGRNEGNVSDLQKKVTCIFLWITGIKRERERETKRKRMHTRGSASTQNDTRQIQLLK